MNSGPGGFSTKNTETLFVFLTTGEDPGKYWKTKEEER
jgi:hypothetical protein